MKEIIIFFKDYFTEDFRRVALPVALLAAIFIGCKISADCSYRRYMAEENAKQESEQICNTPEKSGIVKLQLDVNTLNYAE